MSYILDAVLTGGQTRSLQGECVMKVNCLPAPDVVTYLMQSSSICSAS